MSPEDGSGEPVEPEVQKAKDAALRFLAYRPRSEGEVRRRLLRRYPATVVEQVVNALKEQRYVDDSAFARQWRENREQHRPRSRRLVSQELRQFGVSPEIVQAALEGFDNDDNAYQAVSKLARRLQHRSYSKQELERRIWAHLRRRGFGPGEIRCAVERLLPELGADLLHRQHDTENDKY